MTAASAEATGNAVPVPEPESGLAVAAVAQEPAGPVTERAAGSKTKNGLTAGPAVAPDIAQFAMALERWTAPSAIETKIATPAAVLGKAKSPDL